MKSNRNRIPALHEIYQQKKDQEVHKKRLSEIRVSRRRSLIPTIDVSRTNQMQHIKTQKHITFMKKLYQQQDRIAKENLSLFSKLQKTIWRRPATNNNNRKDVHSSLNLTNRKEEERRNKIENQKMNKRVQASSSSIRTSKLVEQYSKSQRIRDRISRYAKDATLKSQRYLLSSQHRSRSNSLNLDVTQNQLNNIEEKQQKKNKIAMHYKKEEILKNKIERFSWKPDIKKPKTSHKRENGEQQTNRSYGNDPQFFPTQTQN